jgi:hypothetical protein
VAEDFSIETIAAALRFVVEAIDSDTAKMVDVPEWDGAPDWNDLAATFLAKAREIEMEKFPLRVVADANGYTPPLNHHTTVGTESVSNFVEPAPAPQWLVDKINDTIVRTAAADSGLTVVDVDRHLIDEPTEPTRSDSLLGFAEMVRIGLERLDFPTVTEPLVAIPTLVEGALVMRVEDETGTYEVYVKEAPE